MTDPGGVLGVLGDGRYELLALIGRGGMAGVYRAFDTRLEVFRAIKVLNPDLSARTSTRERLEQEARTMARLHHPNIVTVHDVGSDETQVYLVMELLLGGSLMDRVERGGPLPPRMAADVMQCVLSALDLAHERGVIHRDIKPHNVLLDVDGTAKVTDFGIARMTESGLTRTGAVMGTLAYMPPEQRLSARRVDERADVYSAGATLYALLTGKEPFDLYAAAIDERLQDEFFQGMPPALVPVIRRATAYRPEDRFPTAMAMLTALAEAVTALPPDGEAPPLVRPEAQEVAKEMVRSADRLRTASIAPPPPAESTLAEIPTVEPRPPRQVVPAPWPEVVPEPRPPERRAGAWWLLLLLPLAAIPVAGLVIYAASGEPPPPQPPPPVVVPATPPAPVVVETVVPPPAPVVQAPPAPVVASAPVPPPVRKPPPQPVPVPEPEPVPVQVPAPQPIIVVTPPPPPPPPPAPVVETPKPPPPAPTPTSKWSIRQTAVGAVLTLPADAVIHGYPDRTYRPNFVVVCDNGKERAYFDVGMPAEASWYEGEGLNTIAMVILTLDAGADQTFKARKEENSLYLQGNVQKLLEQAVPAKELRLIFTPFSSAPTQTTFTLKGLDVALKGYCGW